MYPKLSSLNMLVLLLLQISCSIAIIGAVNITGERKWPATTPLHRMIAASSFDDFDSINPEWEREFAKNVTAKNKKIVRVLASTTFGGLIFPGGLVTTMAHAFALQRLKTLPNFLPDYELVFEMFDDECIDHVGVSSLIAKLQQNDQAKERFPLVALTECGMEGQRLSAQIVAPYNVIGFSAFAQDVRLFFERRFYKTYYGMGERGDHYCVGLAQFILAMGWKRAAIISDTDVWDTMLDSNYVTWFEHYNIELVHHIRFPITTRDEYELSSNIYEMKLREPRVIVIQSQLYVILGCYLYRFGMFGPAYVYITIDWMVWDENVQIPDFLSSWCTRDMLMTVLDSYISHDMSTLAIINGPNHTDISGMTPSAVKDIFRAKIDDYPNFDLMWHVFVPLQYDRAVAIGLILNSTEAILKQKNMSLTDWFTNSEKFKKNSKEILDTIRKGVYQLSMVGFKGEYGFDEKADWSTGSMPKIYTQVHTERDATSKSGFRIKKETIAYYKVNNPPNKTLVVFWDRVLWRTADGKPPRDALEVINIEIPLISQAGSSFLKALSALEIAMLTVMAGLIMAVKFGRIKLAYDINVNKLDLLGVAGQMVMLGHVFAYPVGNPGKEELEYYCLAISLALWAGCSMFLSSTNQTMVRIVGDREEKQRMAFCGFWTILQTVLLFSAFRESRIQVRVNRVMLDYSDKDPSLAFQSIRNECQVVEAFFANIVSTVLISITAAFQGLLLINSGYKAISFNFNPTSRSMLSRTKMKRYSVFLYATILFILAAAFIGFLEPNNNQYLAILIIVIVLVIGAGHIGVLAVQVFIKPPFAKQPAKAPTPMRLASKITKSAKISTKSQNTATTQRSNLRSGASAMSTAASSTVAVASMKTSNSALSTDYSSLPASTQQSSK